MGEMLIEEEPNTEVRHHYERSVSEFAKWNVLGVIGSSTIGKAAIVVPILGYLVLFNQEVVDFLRLHSDFCKDCSVPWRLNFFYFGCVFVAIGSIVYALACPPMIERHPRAHDFFDAEKEYYKSSENRRFLVGHILKSRSTTYIKPKYMYPPTPDDPMMRLTTLPDLLGQHYFLENRSRRWARIIILIAYSIGAILLAIPTVATVIQVSLRLLR